MNTGYSVMSGPISMFIYDVGNDPELVTYSFVCRKTREETSSYSSGDGLTTCHCKM